MTSIYEGYLNAVELAAPLSEPDANALAAELGELSGLQIYPRSFVAVENCLFFLGRREETKRLGIIAAASKMSRDFEGRSARGGRR